MFDAIVFVFLALFSVILLNLALSYRHLQRDVHTALEEFEVTREQHIQREQDAYDEIHKLQKQLDNAYISLKLALGNDIDNHSTEDVDA